jgi:coatomer subunit beta'
VLHLGTKEAEVEFDAGVVVALKLGRDEPLYLMDHSGKLVYTSGSEVLASSYQIAAEDVTPKAHAFRYHRAIWVNTDIRQMSL